MRMRGLTSLRSGGALRDGDGQESLVSDDDIFPVDNGTQLMALDCKSMYDQ